MIEYNNIECPTNPLLLLLLLAHFFLSLGESSAWREVCSRNLFLDLSSGLEASVGFGVLNSLSGR